jgi:hypothetical protein
MQCIALPSSGARAMASTFDSHPGLPIDLALAFVLSVRVEQLGVELCVSRVQPMRGRGNSLAEPILRMHSANAIGWECIHGPKMDVYARGCRARQKSSGDAQEESEPPTSTNADRVQRSLAPGKTWHLSGIGGFLDQIIRSTCNA